MRGIANSSNDRLNALLICPDAGLSQALQAASAAVAELNFVAVDEKYPDGATLASLAAQHGLDAIFLDVGQNRQAALALVTDLTERSTQLSVVGIDRSNDPETILHCLRAGAAEFLSSPFPANDVRQAVLRMMRRKGVEARPSAPKRGRILAFAPVKGGSGCTTLALNTALALRKETRGRVLLADLNLSAGIIAFLLRLKTGYNVIDALRHSSQLDEALWKSLVVEHGGIDVLAAPERPEPALIEPYPVQEMLDFCRTLYDYIVVDVGGVCEGVGMTVVSASDTVNLVCSVDMPALFLMRRTIPLLEEMGRSRDQLNVLVNRLERRSELSPADMEKIFRASVQATFPEDAAAVQRAHRDGSALSDSSDLARSVRKFAQNVAGKRPQSESKPLGAALKQLWGGA